MSEPNNSAEIIAACANGDLGAQSFLEAYYDLCHTIDDVFDGPVPSAEYFVQAILRFTLEVGGNPFYQRNRASLESLIEQSASAWLCANRMEQKGQAEARVLKSHYHQVFWHVSRLTGGWQRMRDVSRAFREFKPEDSHGPLRQHTGSA